MYLYQQGFRSGATMATLMAALIVALQMPSAAGQERVNRGDGGHNRSGFHIPAMIHAPRVDNFQPNAGGGRVYNAAPWQQQTYSVPAHGFHSNPGRAWPGVYHRRVERDNVYFWHHPYVPIVPRLFIRSRIYYPWSWDVDVPTWYYPYHNYPWWSPWYPYCPVPIYVEVQPQAAPAPDATGSADGLRLLDVRELAPSAGGARAILMIGRTVQEVQVGDDIQVDGRTMRVKAIDLQARTVKVVGADGLAVTLRL